MKISKAMKRDRRRQRKKYGHTRDGDSVKVIERLQRERADEIRQKREEKEALISSVE